MSAAEDHITIAERFRGPPRSGNGGYVGGRFAALLDLPVETPVEVTLRAPVPLDLGLRVERDDDKARVLSETDLIAEVQPSTYELTIPAPPSWEAALAAQPESASFQVREGGTIPGFEGTRGFHPICFCCGADHDSGLGVFAAKVDDHQVAAAWQTQTSWGDENGHLPSAFIWTALDCPGQFAYAAQGIRTGLLGRITTAVFRPAIAGERYRVTAWPEGIDGKKHFAGSAVFNDNGDLIASARAVWIGRRN